MKVVPSPGHVWVAEVIDSDQGALGGDTLVNVQRAAPSLHLGVGALSPCPIRVYTGDWGEYETMEIEWQSDDVLLIDGRPCPMPAGENSG